MDFSTVNIIIIVVMDSARTQL